VNCESRRTDAAAPHLVDATSRTSRWDAGYASGYDAGYASGYDDGNDCT
jgi:hypothetical protein